MFLVLRTHEIAPLSADSRLSEASDHKREQERTPHRQSHCGTRLPAAGTDAGAR